MKKLLSPFSIMGIGLILIAVAVNPLTFEVNKGFNLWTLVVLDTVCVATGMFFIACGAWIKAHLKQLLLPIVNLAVVFIFFEGMFVVLLNRPAIAARMPTGIHNAARSAYLSTRSVIQYEPLCGRYDPLLTYTLRPGQFTFSNVEFSTDYLVNSRGYRGNEDVLTGSDIVVVGDSFAMGWGVSQKDVYSEIIMARTPYRVANTAVASYGTVREMRTLSTLDLSETKYLVIHYVHNDFDENEYYFKNGRLDIMSQADYDHVSELERRNKRYFPGKHCFVVFKGIVTGRTKWLFSKRDDGVSQEEVKYLLHAIITAADVDFDQTRIILLYTDGNAGFTQCLREKIQSPDLPSAIQNMTILDLSEDTQPTIFALDTHFQKEGHERIADALIRTVNELERASQSL